MALTVAHTTSTAKANNPAYDISANAWNGTAAHTVAFTSGSLTGTGETVTSSTPVLDLTQTWNNAAAGFTGIKLNITNTSSLATSAYLVDLQVGGTSRFKVDAGGRAILSPTGWQDPFGFGSLLEVDALTSAASLQVNRWDAGAGPPRTVFTKSRGAAIGTAGALLSGDQLFELVGYGYDAGPALQESVSILAAVDAAPTVGSIPGRIIFSTAASGSATPTERMRIDSTGTVTHNRASLADGETLFDVQVGGVSRFRLGGYGANTTLWLNNSANADDHTNYAIFNDGFGGTTLNGAVSAMLAVNNVTTLFNTSGYFRIGSGSVFSWSSGTDPSQTSADTSISRVSAGILGVHNQATLTSPAAFQVYNTSDVDHGTPTNYERGVFDWTTSPNVLTIGTQNGGTGTARQLQFVIGGVNKLDHGVTLANTWSTGDDFKTSGNFNAGNNAFYVSSSLFHAFLWNGGIFGWTPDSSVSSSSALDTGLARTVANVVEINTGTKGALTGCYLHWGGQARVTSDFNTGNSTTLTNVTGLSVTVAAGRTYHFETELYLTDAAAGGAKAAIGGTATATAINYTGYMIADNAIKAKTNATALATAVASSVTTETSGIIIRITGTITVNAAGTLTVQLAQNTGNATGTVAKQGSYFIVHDMP